MGRSRETYGKKEVRKKKEKKRKDKLAKKQEKRETEKKGGLDNMLAYVDEFGNITSEPPEKIKKEETKLEDIEISVAKKDDTEDSKEKIGMVTQYNSSKGFGFIKDSENKESIFFHVTNTNEDVVEGNRVTYEPGKGPKGKVALNISLKK